MLEPKKIIRAMSSLYEKYPQFHWALEQLEFSRRYNEEGVEKLSTDGRCILYQEEYFYFVSLEQVEEEIMHLMFHNRLGHNERFIMYPDEELREAIMDFQVAWIMNEIGMLKKEKKECLEYLLNTVCEGKCDFRIYQKLQEDKEKKERFLNYMTTLCSDNHKHWGN